jgi:hypothetical protein
MPNPFPSLRARAMLAVLQGKLGYEIERQSGSLVAWLLREGRRSHSRL